MDNVIYLKLLFRSWIYVEILTNIHESHAKFLLIWINSDLLSSEIIFHLIYHILNMI